jgi:hypothetical protein
MFWVRKFVSDGELAAMAKRTNRVAWGLAVILAVVVLGGIGGMLTHGIQLGSHYYWTRWDGKWATGRNATFCDLCTCFTSFHLGFITLGESFPDPNPMCVKLRSQASTRNGTGR